jgi:hypothetical protein
MLAHLFWLLATAPPLTPADTSQVFTGMLNQRYAWGTAVLRSGQVLRAYLPASAAGLDGVVPYYPSAPEAGARRPPRPKLLAVDEVRWTRVQGQYSEVLKPNPNETGRLAARRATGELELFVVRRLTPVVVNLLGSSPVLSAPVAGPQVLGEGTTAWYLRRPPAAAVLIEPPQFASQVAAFLAKDPELARRVAAGAPGHGPADLEKLVRQYNQRGQRIMTNDVQR